VGMANPAANYASAMGYEYKVVETATGEKGVVKLPNGEEVDEWAFYRGEVGQQYSYCAKMGWHLAAKPEKDSLGTECATCELSNGSKQTVSQLLDLTRKSTFGETKLQASAISSTIDSNGGTISATALGLPSHFDWRNNNGQNWVTPVKDQGSCGSCWAFSAVGAVEPQYRISLGDSTLDIDLSEQYLVSCSYAGSCSGGDTATALAIIKNQGIPDEACFSYTGSDSPCSSKCSDYSTRLKKIDSTGYVTSDIATIEEYLVEKGPLSAAMGIGSDYGGYFDSNGIYRSTIHTGFNHAVVIVGYDQTGGYWIVKNSWGTGWGDNGYFKVGFGECAIESYVYYASLNPGVPPAAPNLVSPTDGSSVTGSSITFQWSATNRASTYWLEVNSDANWSAGNRLYYAAVSTNYATVTGLADDGTTYYWRVWAGNSNGWSAPTPGWSILGGTPGGGPPETPTLISPADGATFTGNPPTFRWSAPSGATYYWLEVNRDPNWGVNTRFYYGGVSATAQTLTGFPSNGTTYYWRVWAANAKGWSAPSSGWSVIHEVPPPPETPTLISPVDGATFAGTPPTFQWSAPSGATYYWLEVNRDPNWGAGTRFYYGAVSATAQTLTGFPSNGTTYYWRVWAANDGGWSAPSSGWTVIHEVPPPPETPTLLSPSDGATFAGTPPAFQWSAPSGATYYWLEVNRDPNWGVNTRFYYGAVSANSMRLTGFPSNGTTYYWRVWAANDGGWSAPSSAWTVIHEVPPPPETPTLISPVDGATFAGTSPTFQWSAPSGATYYWLEVNRDPNWGEGTRFYYGAVSANSMRLTGFPSNGTTYYWRVWAANDGGWSAPSSGWTVLHETPNPPETPILISPVDGATFAGTSLTFQWSAVSGATIYWLEVNRDPNWGVGTKFYDASVSTNSQTLSGFPSDGTTYYWRVWAGNAGGWSAATAGWQVHNP
jgi:C1A family cysteine protease